jgi:hypothetical protein
VCCCFGLQNKKERKKVREVGILKKDPDQIKKQIENLEMMSKLRFILLTKVLHWREVKSQYHFFCITISIMLA